MLSHRYKSYGLLVLLSLICASFNLTKPVHIDDTAHLLIARKILEDPLHPMSGELNLASNTALPISSINQPFLFFYLQALVMLFFGQSELAQHLLMALITSIAIGFFYRLARLLVPKHALFLTALFVLGPVFIPGQNLMTDVPVVTLWLIFFWAVFSVSDGGPTVKYWIGSAAIGAACLVKYTSLILLPIFLFVIVLRRQWRALWTLSVPVVALVGWSFFNYFDYGHVHILNRSLESFGITMIILKAVEWFVGVGAIAPFSVIFLSRENIRRPLWIAAVCLFAGEAMFLVSYGYYKSFYLAAWWALFFINGIFTISLVNISLMRGRKGNDKIKVERNLILFLWLAGAFTFIVLFAPFMAIRHIMLAVPGILLLLGYNFEHSIECRQGIFGLILTATLGILIALSDYSYAAIYRDYAPKIVKELPFGATIWYTRYRSWQWYADLAGMRQYDTERTIFKNGDYVIVPGVVTKQKAGVVIREKILPHHQQILKKVRQITVNAKPVTWLRTMSEKPYGGYYLFSLGIHGPPWLFSTAPLETFSIFVIEYADPSRQAK